MPTVQPFLARGQAQVEPGHLVLLYFIFSAGGLFYTLSPPPHVLEKAGRVWSDSSSPAAYEEAKQLSNQVLDLALQDSLTTFFLVNCLMSTSAVTWLITKVVFLGRLSVIETNKLTERLLMYGLLKVVFFGAVVTPSVRDVGAWAAWFLMMGYFKMFVGLAGDRCEALLSSPASTPLQHLRCLALLLGILAHVAGWMADYVRDPGRWAEGGGLSAAALWLFDGATVVVEATHGTIKYGVHALERWRSQRAEQRGEDGGGPWEWQGSFLYHLELGSDMLLHCLTLAHYLHLWIVHGLKFQLIDMILFLDVRYLAIVMWRRLQDHRKYRRLTQLVKHSFADASAEQLEGAECAICMERMSRAKVLPCRHTFHISCLRAWLQQCHGSNFSCPMCRASLLVDEDVGGGQAQQQWQGGGGCGGRARAWQRLGQPQQAPAAVEGGAVAEPVGALLAEIMAGSRAAAQPAPAPGLSGTASAAGELGWGQEEESEGAGGSRLGRWRGTAGLSLSYAREAAADFWEEVACLSEGEGPCGSGITLTTTEAGTAQAPSRSRGTYHTASTCRRRSTGGSASRGAAPADAAGGSGSEGPGPSLAQLRGVADANLAAAAVVLEQLRSLSAAAASQLAGLPGARPSQQGAICRGEGEEEEEEGVVNQPPPGCVRHRYPTRASRR